MSSGFPYERSCYLTVCRSLCSVFQCFVLIYPTRGNTTGSRPDCCVLDSGSSLHPQLGKISTKRGVIKATARCDVRDVRWHHDGWKGWKQLLHLKSLATFFFFSTRAKCQTADKKQTKMRGKRKKWPVSHSPRLPPLSPRRWWCHWGGRIWCASCASAATT